MQMRVPHPIPSEQGHRGDRRRWLRAVVFAALSFGSLGCGEATAQSAGIVANGNAIVTGFSGAIPPVMIPPGTDPVDKMFIDLNGPSARVLDLQSPGAPPQAQLLTAPKPFTVTAAQTGQLFGVALDNATPPNVFVAATSAYGLPIVVPTGAAQFARAKQGAPNAAFMPGLFGPAQFGSGPGSIWRIDGTTGEARLFANVALDGAANPGPALGGLAFDAASNTLFVADRATGMIHAFDSTGTERARYDHGVQGRSAAGLPPVPYDPSGHLDISSPKFRTGDPATWGYANPQRLIFGLAVRNGRLYYAVARDLQVWSVSIAPKFGAEPRLELSVAPGAGPSEIAKIAFDDQGRMLLAERAAPSGAYDFNALTVDATGRVLRYLPAPPDTAGPQWQPQADEYAVGFARQMRNGNGGVAVGFGYDDQGRIDRAACGQFLWSTGEQLRNSSDPAVASQLAAGGPVEVNGLQGNDILAVRPANVPPWQSYFADYDDQFQDSIARGHLGDVAIARVCGQIGFNLPGWYRPRVEIFPGFFWLRVHGKKPPLLDCPPGSGNQCACPPGTSQQPGFQCCPFATYPGPNGTCTSPCPDGSTDPAKLELCLQGFDAGKFDPNDWSTLVCLDGSKPVHDANGYHCPVFKSPVCPVGFEPDPSAKFFGCKPTAQEMNCETKIDQFNQIGLDGNCHQLCPSGSWAFVANQCCPDGTLPGPDGKCGKPHQPTCPPAQLTSKGICCAPGSTPQPDGTCRAKEPCPPQQLTVSGQCCPAGSAPQPDGTCQPPLKQGCAAEQLTPDGTCCPAGTKPQPDNSCKPPVSCPSGTTVDPVTGQCCPPATAVAGTKAACTCPTGQMLINGKCTSDAGPTGCFAGYVKLPNGSCCLASQATAGGQCCPAGQKPDADKRNCVPAGGATFAPGKSFVPAPVVVPSGKRGKAVKPSRVRPPGVAVPPPPPPKFVVPPKRFTPRPIVRPTPLPRVRGQIER
ncbi:hypothetical protein L6654_40255 [Bradyrhizobium sp. WYCCWR 13023]|uniref:Uncharacterized protein n=1 Tax=Bradyrhizobium zhengyangense TaxID=2911009 RepID=A0A9X1RHK4_9BRAD|nr:MULTISPECIES: hypothetical protein [Bradyrhizobium]MCG2632824.1 hypothetical protein [Bradyrhizobium zhengyangense]